MEISLLKALLNNISTLYRLSSSDNLNVEPAMVYYQKIEEILKLLRPILDTLVDSDIASDKLLTKAFEEFDHCIDELRELFESWHPLKSKLYFALQIDQSVAKLRNSGLGIFQLLESFHPSLPDELSSASLQHCIQKITHMGYEQTSAVIKEALNKHVESDGPSSEALMKIADCLNLKSNQVLLIEAVALEKLKENAEQAENSEEADYVDQMIALVTHMHDNLITTKQSESCSPVPIPPDFCCPLSLELMTDPVIVASGQTYERAYIKNWIDLGLTVCPKTKQTLAHTNLIPNYTVKALIANWCESNDVKLPDPMKSLTLTQSSPLHPHADSGATRGNQPLSPESARSIGSPGDNLILPGAIRREETSPIHPRSSSEGSLSNVNGVDSGRISVVGSEDGLVNSEQRNSVSGGQPSLPPSRKEISNAILVDEQLSHNHNRTSSDSSTHSNANFPQGISGDASEASQPHGRSSAYDSDASGEMVAEPPAAATAAVITPQREVDFPPRLERRSGSQTFWRRPSERFVPRIVPSPTENRADLSGVETQVRKLVEDLQSDSLEDQREATTQLRLLARNNMDNRIVIANSGAISLLVGLLRSTDTRIQENAVTALLNLSINDNNKAAIANADAIEPLIHVLETGSSEAKENSAATLFSLSVIEENKMKIGRSGAIRPLVDLLGNGTPRGKKDAATALFNLSILHENKARIVQASAVRHLVDLMDPAAGMVDKAVAVLANLATIPEGRTAIGLEGGIPVLVEVVELGSARGKENAAAALLQLCTTSNRHSNLVLQEGAVPPLVALSQSGTPRAKEKAQNLLSHFRNNRHGGAGRG